MDRKKRAVKRFAKGKTLQSYEKRENTTDRVRHYILYPVVTSTIGKSNDFYFHALQLIWNDRNIFKDSQCKKLLQGLYWKQDENDAMDIEKLARAKGNEWFTSSRQSDLATIGKVAGYFLRRFASSVGKAMDERFNLDTDCFIGPKNLNDLFEVLRDNQTIIPAIVKLDISPNSKFDHSKLICLTKDIVNILHNGEKAAVSRRAELLKINAVFHERAWRLLNSLSNEIRHEIMEELLNNSVQMKTIPSLVENETVHLPVPVDKNLTVHLPVDENLVDGFPINALQQPIELIECPLEVLPPNANKNRRSKVCRQLESRPASSRSKERNRKYPLELYIMK